MIRMIALLGVAGIVGLAMADDVLLTNGRILQGKVSYVDGKIHLYQLNGVVILDKSKVVSVEEKSTPLHEYERRFSEIWASGKATADDFAALASFASGHGMKSQAESMYKQALSIDPNHTAARSALGYVRLKDKWLTPDEAAQAQGLIRHEGKWITPELRAALVRAEAMRAEMEAQKLKLKQAEQELAIAEAQSAKSRADAERAKAHHHRRRVQTVHISAPSQR